MFHLYIIPFSFSLYRLIFHEIGLDVFQKGLNEGSDDGPSKPCLGYRVNKSPYIWLSYQTIHDRFTHFGSGLLHLVRNSLLFFWLKSI